eukprot:gene21579-25953_t
MLTDTGGAPGELLIGAGGERAGLLVYIDGTWRALSGKQPLEDVLRYLSGGYPFAFSYRDHSVLAMGEHIFDATYGIVAESWQAYLAVMTRVQWEFCYCTADWGDNGCLARDGAAAAEAPLTQCVPLDRRHYNE